MTTKRAKAAPASIELFTCERHEGELRVSKAFCGQSWRRVQLMTDPADRARLWPCLRCPVGKRNAQAADEVAAPVPRKQQFTLAQRARLDRPLEVERKRRSRVAL